MNKFLCFMFILSMVLCLPGCNGEKQANELDPIPQTEPSIPSNNIPAIPEISSFSDILSADFQTIKARMGYSLNGPIDEWRGNAEKLLHLKNLDQVSCYMNISSNPSELIGVDSNGIVFFGVYGTSAYAYVKDFLSDEALMVDPVVYTIEAEKIDALVWKMQNGYLAIPAMSLPNLNWYDRPALGMVHVRDIEFLSFIDISTELDNSNVYAGGETANKVENIKDFIKENETFIDFNTNTQETIYTLPQNNSLYAGEPGRWTLIDLDADGEQELLVEYDWAGDTAILHKIGDTYYAFYIGYRSISGLKADGTMSWSSSAFESGVSRLRFSTQGIISENIITYNTEDNVYIVDGVEVSKDVCDAALRSQHEKKDVRWNYFN